MAIHQLPTYNHLYDQLHLEDMTSLSALVRAALVLAVAAQGALAQHCTCNYDAGSVDFAISQSCCEQTGGFWDPSRLDCDVEYRPGLFADCCIAAGLPFQPCYD
uniref:Alcohol dehydrogenase 1 n=1 Tax=Ganoderma boninense TaxID=34458 RepID=A0A5K1K6K5_9APHY|nr:Alcohol dehydrogenase 1 [Ganoderma boninense]